MSEFFFDICSDFIRRICVCVLFLLMIDYDFLYTLFEVDVFFRIMLAQWKGVLFVFVGHWYRFYFLKKKAL